MKVYLITEEQIRGLYDAVTAGSRNFERVIEQVQRQEVGMADPEAWEGVKEALRARGLNL